MKWFGVRTFYRTRVKGRPRRTDKHYVAGLTVVEERVVLFSARNAPAAARKGRREGEQYCEGNATTNVYGQEVVTELLRHIEVHELDGDPADGQEIFSAMERGGGGELDPETGRMFISADIAEAIVRRG